VGYCFVSRKIIRESADISASAYFNDSTLEWSNISTIADPSLVILVCQMHSSCRASRSVKFSLTPNWVRRKKSAGLRGDCFENRDGGQPHATLRAEETYRKVYHGLHSALDKTYWR
jgi:hypothetical protein